MSEVKARLIDGASVTQDENGFTVVEVWDVKNVGGTSAQRQYLAINDPSVPAYGSIHPVVTTTRVKNKSIDSLGAEHARVRITWETPTGGGALQLGDPAVWEISAAIEQVQIRKDQNGDEITVSYTYPDTEQWQTFGEGRLVGKTIDQVGVLTVPRAAFALRVRQAEARDVIAIAGDAASFVGRVSNSTFLGHPARTWLCASIGAANPIGVTPTEVAYELLFNPDTWDVPVSFVDPITNRIPTDLVDGTGKKIVRVIGEANLNSLPI